jgi:hypothetical protein
MFTHAEHAIKKCLCMLIAESALKTFYACWRALKSRMGNNRSFSSTKACMCYPWTCLFYGRLCYLDVSVLQQTLLPGRVCISLSCPWTCLLQSSLCCPWSWKCLFIHLLSQELSGLQQLVLPLEVSVYESLCCTCTCAFVLSLEVSVYKSLCCTCTCDFVLPLVCVQNLLSCGFWAIGVCGKNFLRMLIIL